MSIKTEQTLSSSTPKSRTRCSWSLAERAEWLKLLEESGQSLSAFCRENDLPESSVSLWRRQQRERDSEIGENEFVEVALPSACASPTRSDSAIVIQLANNRRLEVAAGTDVDWLAALLRAL